MRKSIDFTDSDIKAIEDFREQKGIKSFSEAVRQIVRVFTTIEAPKSAGEI